MKKSTPKTSKFNHKCGKCNNLLTIKEKAFNETLCDNCQYKTDADTYMILAAFIRGNKIILEK